MDDGRPSFSCPELVEGQSLSKGFVSEIILFSPFSDRGLLGKDYDG